MSHHDNTAEEAETTRLKIGRFIFFITGPVAALYHWQWSGFLKTTGAIPLEYLVAIAIIGGAFGFALAFDGIERWAAIIPGAVAGGGPFLLFHIYATNFTRIPKAEFLIAFIGPLPGVLLCWLVHKFIKLCREDKAKEVVETHPTAAFESSGRIKLS
jgi:hypothetical protein